MWERKCIFILAARVEPREGMLMTKVCPFISVVLEISLLEWPGNLFSPLRVVKHNSCGNSLQPVLIFTQEAKRLEEEAAARKREEAARRKEEERKRKEEEKEKKPQLEEERKRETEEQRRLV
jgi:membrane protein involved in colicin uptake